MVIDKEKLIEAILEHKDKIKSCDKRVNEVYSLAHDHIIDIINAQPKTDWIPCEESLPSEIEASIVTIDDGEVCIGVYRTDDKVWYTRRIEGETVYTKEHKVIAWQPLPQPCKKEGA